MNEYKLEYLNHKEPEMPRQLHDKRRAVYLLIQHLGIPVLAIPPHALGWVQP